MQGAITTTCKDIKEMLNNALNYYIYEERNPFEESRMVFYITNGLNKLNDMNLDDEQIVTMFDRNDVLEFSVEG